MENLTIRLETEKDYQSAKELTREAFRNVYRPGADEHYYVHTMRSHPVPMPELAFVLEKDGQILGNIMYTKACLEEKNWIYIPSAAADCCEDIAAVETFDATVPPREKK